MKKINNTSRKKWSFPLLLLLLFSSLTHFAYAKTVICLDDSKGDSYLNNAEGYVRHQMGQGDIIQVGGSLTDCLAHLVDGDTLIIIAHGVTRCDSDRCASRGEAFSWNGSNYDGFDGDGFAGGTNKVVVPNNFSNLNQIKVKFYSCWSARDPDGTGTNTSLVDKIINAMRNGQGNTGEGFKNRALARVNFRLEGSNNKEEQLKAQQALERDGSWMNQPPINRSTPPPTPNQQTAAQEIVDREVGSGKFKVVIEGEFYQKPQNWPEEDEGCRCESPETDLQQSKQTCPCGLCGFGTSKPLLIELMSLETIAEEGNLYLIWETASETNNLGMNLWCSQLQGPHFKDITQLNSQLIPSKALLPNYGAAYSSTDYPYIDTNLKPGIQHCTLEDIDASGQCTLHCDHIDTIVVGGGQSASEADLNQLNTKAIALCHQYKESLAAAGQEGVCLDQLLEPDMP